MPPCRRTVVPCRIVPFPACRIQAGISASLLENPVVRHRVPWGRPSLHSDRPHRRSDRPHRGRRPAGRTALPGEPPSIGRGLGQHGTTGWLVHRGLTSTAGHREEPRHRPSGGAGSWCACGVLRSRPASAPRDRSRAARARPFGARTGPRARRTRPTRACAGPCERCSRPRRACGGSPARRARPGRACVGPDASCTRPIGACHPPRARCTRVRRGCTGSSVRCTGTNRRCTASSARSTRPLGAAASGRYLESGAGDSPRPPPALLRPWLPN